MYERDKRTVNAAGKYYFSKSFIGELIEVKPKSASKKKKGKVSRRHLKSPLNISQIPTVEIIVDTP